MYFVLAKAELDEKSILYIFLFVITKINFHKASNTGFVTSMY